jgi:nucleotide-binding universal stress UspA family protein
MKRILALTDFSNHADHALDYACTLTNKYDTEEIVILNTYETVPLYDTGDITSASISMHESEEMETQRKEALNRLVKRIKPSLHPAVKLTTRLTNNNLVDAVNGVCLNQKIDLVVMGIKIKNEMEQVLLGSHAHRAIEKINQPVLVVPVNSKINPPEKILLVTNFYEAENKPALKSLKEYLSKLQVPIVIAHKLWRKENKKQTEILAERLKSELREYFPSIIIIEDEKSLGDNVNEIAQEHHISLVISLHKKRGFFSRLFHNSASKHLTWYSRVPVLVLHFE